MSHCLEDRGGATFGDGTNPGPLAVGRQPPWRAICLGNCPSIWIAGVATYDVSDYSQTLSTHLYQENDGCVFWTVRYQLPYLQASVDWRIRNTWELNSLLLFSHGGRDIVPMQPHTQSAGKYLWSATGKHPVQWLTKDYIIKWEILSLTIENLMETISIDIWEFGNLAIKA